MANQDTATSSTEALPKPQENNEHEGVIPISDKDTPNNGLVRSIMLLIKTSSRPSELGSSPIFVDPGNLIPTLPPFIIFLKRIILDYISFDNMQSLPSAFWRSMVLATPLEKRSPHLDRREDKIVTETITQTETQTINETFTVHHTTRIYSTILSTITVPTTVDHTVTINPSTTSLEEASPPPSPDSTDGMISVARIAPNLAASSGSSTMLALSQLPFLFESQSSASAAAKTSKPSPTPLPSTSVPNPTPASAVPTPSPSVTASTKSKMPVTTILAITLGVLAFLALLIAGLLFARRMYRKYRQQRVLRKQIQTEGNEIPTAVIVAAAANQEIEERGRVRASSPGGCGFGGAGHDVAAAAKAAEAWEEYPPAYRV